VAPIETLRQAITAVLAPNKTILMATTGGSAAIISGWRRTISSLTTITGVQPAIISDKLEFIRS
jgi:hypothetical protein